MVAKVAYIIVCWNNKDLLDECLTAIQKQTYAHKEIYLIDNNSSDGSAEYVEKNYPSVHLVKSSENSGFAKGNNILISQALEDEEIKYFALVNTDAMLDKDWTKTIIDEIATRDNVAGAQGITIDYKNRHLIDSHHIYVAENFQSVQYGYREKYIENAYHTEKVMGVNAAAAIYTRDYIEEQPYDTFFDERFFMYLEDVDVSLRALVIGRSNYFVAGAKAYHMGSASSNKRSSDFSLYYTARNQLGLLMKNIPTKILLKYSAKALKFEIQFIRHLKKQYGGKTQRVYIKGRIIGFFRAFIYIGDRVKLSRVRKKGTDFTTLLLIRGKGKICS